MTIGPYRTMKIEEHPGHVLKVIFDHPDNAYNFIDLTATEDFAELFRDLRNETEARCILLTGSGRCFSGGGSHGMMRQFQTDPRVVDRAMMLGRQTMYDALYNRIPVVCAMNGHAAGYGLSIALLSDIIFAVDRATLSDPHVVNGVTAGDGPGLWSLFLSPVKAKQYLFTGDKLTAAEAERLGLVNFVCDPEELNEKSMAYAARLAAGPPMSIQRTKMVYNRLLRRAYEDCFELGMAYESIDFGSSDHKEAVSAVTEHRPPFYSGR